MYRNFCDDVNGSEVECRGDRYGECKSEISVNIVTTEQLLIYDNSLDGSWIHRE